VQPQPLPPACPLHLPAPNRSSQKAKTRQAKAGQRQGRKRKELTLLFPPNSPLRQCPSDSHSPFDHPRGKTSRRQLNRAGLSRLIVVHQFDLASTATTPSPQTDRQCLLSLHSLSCAVLSPITHTHCPERPFPRRPVSSRLNTPKTAPLETSTSHLRQRATDKRRQKPYDHLFALRITTTGTIQAIHLDHRHSASASSRPFAEATRAHTHTTVYRLPLPTPTLSPSPAHTGDGSTPETEGRILGSFMGP
jgi:hypothetical protein